MAIISTYLILALLLGALTVSSMSHREIITGFAKVLKRVYRTVRNDTSVVRADWINVIIAGACTVGAFALSCPYFFGQVFSATVLGIIQFLVRLPYWFEKN